MQKRKKQLPCPNDIRKLRAKFRFQNRWVKISFLTCLLTGLFAPGLSLGENTITLAWDQSNSSSIAGYKIYYGAAPGQYTNVVDMGNVVTGNIGNLASGVMYYFAATAYDGSFVESSFSNEITWTKTTSEPTITSIANQTINVNQTTPTLTFTVGDHETPAANLLVTGRSSNTTLVPNSGITLSGTGSSRSVVVKPASGQVGTCTITIRVSDGSLTNSTSFTLKVNPLPTVALDSPRTGTSFTAPADVEMTASVVTNGNTISRVSFYNGSTLLGSDSSPPYKYSWRSVATGNYTVSAKVVYNGSNTRSSSTASIAVRANGLVLAASSATLTGPFQLSGGLISQSITTGVTNGGRAVYSLQVPVATNYTISADVLAPSSSANSFFVNMDAEPTTSMIWDIPVASTLTSRTVSWRGSGTSSANQYSPKIFSLTAGTHQLIIRGSEANAKLGTVSLTPVSGLVSPWRVATLGTSVTPGLARISGGEHAILGAGTLSGSADRFSFLYQPLSADGEIKAKIVSLDTSLSAAIAGVMVRETLNAGSKYVLVSRAGDGKLRWQRRETTSSGTFNVQTTSSNPWVRILRRGNVLSAYTSANGSTWNLWGSSTNAMASNIYIGLAFASGVTNQLKTAVFSNVQVTP